MDFQFIIPTEINQAIVKVYTSEQMDEQTTRVHFTINGQQTFTDYEERYVSEKIDRGDWILVEM